MIPLSAVLMYRRQQVEEEVGVRLGEIGLRGGGLLPVRLLREEMGVHIFEGKLFVFLLGYEVND